MFNCPTCKGRMVYDWVLGKVMCLTPTCGFETTWEKAMEHCTIDSTPVYYYCWFCKDNQFCTIEENAIRCGTCKTFLEPVENLKTDPIDKSPPKHKFVIEIHDLPGEKSDD